MALGVNELRGTPPRIERTPVTGRVTKVDAQGVWVVPIGGDLRTPVGPCRGPSDIPVGTIVMIIWTQERPWVFGAELLTVLNVDARDLVLLEQAGLDAQTRVDEAADLLELAIADKLNATAYRDTGRRLVVEAGDVTDLPDLEVVTRRRGDVVTVYTREAAGASHAGATTLLTLPAGFRPDAAVVPNVVSDAAGASVADARLVVKNSGQVQLYAVSGARHYSAATFTTSDTWPNPLPGTED